MMWFALMICLLVLLHTIGDFVLQTDSMAMGKSSSNKALLTHTSVYSLTFLGLGFLPVLSWSAALTFVLVNFVAHTITDYFTSRLTTKLWAKGDRHNFFVVIGFDQLAHIAVLILSFTYLAVPNFLW